MAGKKATKWPSEEVKSVGRQALAQAHRAPLERRLEAALLEGLAADLDALDTGQVDTGQALVAQKAATGSERELAKQATNLVVGIRKAMRRSRWVGRAVLKAFAIGERIDANQTSSVLRGLQAVLKGAEKHPEAARTAGVLPTDLEEVQSLRATLAAAEGTQQTQFASRKLTTTERDAVQARVETAIDSISSAGALEFRRQPAIAGQFEALVALARIAPPARRGSKPPSPPGSAT